MNILLISHFFLPHKGGVETAVYNTAKQLISFGHKVIVITSKLEEESRDFHILEDILIYRFKSFNIPELMLLPQISSFGIMPKALFKLSEIIKKYNIHVIHAEGRFFPITFLTVILNNIIFKKPMIITCQGRLKIGITGIFEEIFDKLILKHLIKNVEMVICVSKSLKNRFLMFKINKKKLIVIPNGVDISKFKRITNPEMLKQYLKDKLDYKKVIFAGRLDAQKGVEYLIRAIPLVLKNYQKVHFFILGNGKLEIKLKKLASKLKINSYITFIDAIALDQMPEFYSSADIFCLPSIHEGFPLSLAESLSIGLIVVVSATEGIPEAIKENENGFLVEPKNISQLSNKLLKALTLNDHQVKIIRDNNINLAHNDFSWEYLVKKIIKIYKKSISSKIKELK